MFALVDVQPTGLYDSDSIIFFVDLKDDHGILFCGAKRESRYSPVCGPVNAHASGVCDADSIPFKQKNDHPGGVVILLVDLKGIEPSNLTDANRALSQLSYKPIFFSALSQEPYVLYHRFSICKEKY